MNTKRDLKHEYIVLKNNPFRYKKQLAHQRNWRNRNKDLINSNNALYYKKNKKQFQSYYKTYKSKVIWYYSYGSYRCANCNFYGLPFLSIDHINNDGREKRFRLTNSYTTNQYAYLISNNFPDDIQVLCMGCNWYKGKFGTFPTNFNGRCKCCNNLKWNESEECYNCRWVEGRHSICPHKTELKCATCL